MWRVPYNLADLLAGKTERKYFHIDLHRLIWQFDIMTRFADYQITIGTALRILRIGQPY